MSTERIDRNKEPDAKWQVTKDLWKDFWEYDLEWTLYMASLGGEIGAEHKNRIEAFNRLVNGKRDPIEVPKR